MKILVEGDPSTGALFWRSEDSKYYGALIPPFTLSDREGGEDLAMPAGALLAVPKHSEKEPPSINKHSPLIIQAATIDEVVAALGKWVNSVKGRSLWDLRYRYWES